MNVRKLLGFLSGLFLITLLVTGCTPKETPEQKLEAFKAAHKAVYNAWAATTELELEDHLAKGIVEPFLKEQITQQTAVMKQRLAYPERHGVRELVYHKLEVVEDGSDEFTVAADWTVHGYREHGDVHESKVNYTKKFHLVKDKGIWKIDKMF